MTIDVEEKREILRVFFHIVKNVELEMLRFWWKKIVKKEQEALLQLLQIATRIFEYPGAEAIRMDLLGMTGPKKQDRKKLFDSYYGGGGVGLAASKLREKRALQSSNASSPAVVGSKSKARWDLEEVV